MYLGRHIDTAEYVAVKVIKQDLVEQSELQQIQLEAEILNHLSHRNIARFYEYDSAMQIWYPDGDQSTGVAIVLEFCAGGDLFEFVVQTGYLTEPLARFFFKQLCDALVHMQSNGISHRDLKWENLMLDSNFNLKVIDYGYAAVHNKSESIKGN